MPKKFFLLSNSRNSMKNTQKSFVAPSFKPEKVCNILEKIAKGFGSQSEEYFSIELASKVLLFIWTQQGSQSAKDFLDTSNKEMPPSFSKSSLIDSASRSSQSFQDYLDTWNQDLTPEHKKLLASIGVTTEPPVAKQVSPEKKMFLASVGL